ncbi:uncharacterized protein LOC112268523 [Brachypodium distachyon]|uniref:uncharacterized protein LOC112268523 n=1 Tax=Brachypodium distachyon TaxID=15368 RepID=UPI000D0CA2BE|nr:uncharacterized protein LOC112268523 [Brachypodium distachyon]|eukprot:XP_024313657.1 uncharacterized protein LOC112268523 [Brachypodium distachyon]
MLASGTVTTRYSRVKLPKPEDKGKGVAIGSRRIKKKKYKSDRQCRREKRFSALMKVVEEHHAADSYLIEDLIREMQKRKNLLLHLIAYHLENESSSEGCEEDTTSETRVAEGEQSFHDDATSANPSFKRPNRLPQTPGVWQRTKEVRKEGSEVEASVNSLNVQAESNMSQVGDKRGAEGIKFRKV